MYHSFSLIVNSSDFATHSRMKRRGRGNIVISFLLAVSLFCTVESFEMPLTRTTLSHKVSSSLRPLYASIDEESPSPAKKNLNELLLPVDSCNVNQMSGTDLAYIGDVVFELYIRSRHVWPSKRTSDLQNKVVSIVRAEHQSHLLSQVKEKFDLSDKEKQILMRGRNAVTRSKNRRNPAAYQDSTSFEALVGYLYICDQDRCCELLNWLDSIVDEVL